MINNNWRYRLCITEVMELIAVIRWQLRQVMDMDTAEAATAADAEQDLEAGSR